MPRDKRSSRACIVAHLTQSLLVLPGGADFYPSSAVGAYGPFLSYLASRKKKEKFIDIFISVDYMDLTFSFNTVYDNLIGEMKRLKVIFNRFYPCFLKVSSPIKNTLTFKLSVLLSVASLGLLFT